MNFMIKFKKGQYRRATGRREPNARRLKKILKRVGFYDYAKAHFQARMNQQTGEDN